MTNKDNLEDRKQKLKQQVIEFYTSKQITKQTKDSALDQLENMDKIKPDHYIFCNPDAKMLYLNEGNPSLYTPESQASRVQESLKKQKESSIFHIATNLEEKND